MKAGRKGEGGRSKTEENMMHGSKVETGGKGQHVRRGNIVEDRMMGDVGDRGTSVALRPEERDEHV